MANKRPIVDYSGDLKEISTGDVIDPALLSGEADWPVAPILTADTTGPTLGTGGTTTAKYTQTAAKRIEAWFRFVWGTGGTGGSGEYLLVLPTAWALAIPAAMICGYGDTYNPMSEHRQVENRFFHMEVAQQSGPPVLSFFMDTALGAYHHLRHDNPWAMGASGLYIQGRLTLDLA